MKLIFNLVFFSLIIVVVLFTFLKKNSHIDVPIDDPNFSKNNYTVSMINQKPQNSTSAEEYAEHLRQWLKEGALQDITTTLTTSNSFKDCPECPEMVNIPAGSFMMGSTSGDSDEQSVHRVEISAFAMGKYEVTFKEYNAFTQATGHDKPNDQGWGRGKRPVINVSWEDAVAYAQWLSQKTNKTYRLPTEAEWEYAARAGTETDYWWGNTASHEYANYGKDECCGGLIQGKDQWKFTAPVGSFEQNPFGLYDMHGNVWEWTCSIYNNPYNGSEITCDMTNEGLRVLRGGSWSDNPSGMRSASRDGFNLDNRYDDVGFRLIIPSP